MNPALRSLRTAITCSSKDFSIERVDAWTYGIVIGWGNALKEVAKRHGWDDGTCNHIRHLRKEYKKLEK